MVQDKALVLFSGGQDSATCLAWALSNFKEVETLGFDYGQRHKIELEVRQDFLRELPLKFPRWREKMGQDHLLDLKVLGEISAPSLTFLTLAASLAYQRGIKHIILGVCETDYTGYPDCRDDTIKAMQVALNLGLDTRITLHTPLMFTDKMETWRTAEELGGAKLIALITEHTHSCYMGNRETRHDWGYGCNNCPACDLRCKGFMRYNRVT